jgi:hypothetical protein
MTDAERAQRRQREQEIPQRAREDDHDAFN